VLSCATDGRPQRPAGYETATGALTTGGSTSAVAVMITGRPQHQQARLPGALHQDPLRRSLGKLGGNAGGDLDAVNAAHDRGEHALGPEPFLPAHRGIAENGIGSAAGGRLPGVHHM